MIRYLGILAVGMAALPMAACLVEILEPVPLSSDGGAAGGAGVAPGAGGSGAGSAGGTGGAPACPEDMVLATDGADVAFCVDRTEVTVEDYVTFLAAVGGAVEPSEQHPSCGGNVELTHTPDGSCPDFTSASQLPVQCVDWCDAYAYCSWAGKRLCRALSGEPMDFSDAPVAGEWHYACSGGLKTEYPYGDEPDDTACNVPGTSDRAPVGSFPACEGGFSGIFDMQGNVSEWIDACESDGPAARCKTRGGHTFGTATYWSCDNDVESVPRDDPNEREVGIRCCHDPG